MNKRYYVYIVASRSRNLYVGVTNDLKRRIFEHKEGLIEGFTKKYRIHRLVYFESFSDIRDAIQAEKRIKGWRRGKKVALITANNPTWEDLAADWYDKPVEQEAGPSLRSGRQRRPEPHEGGRKPPQGLKPHLEATRERHG